MASHCCFGRNRSKPVWSNYSTHRFSARPGRSTAGHDTCAERACCRAIKLAPHNDGCPGLCRGRGVWRAAVSQGAGALAGVTVTAASGIEIALWDLAGRILETPVCNLLGGRFRDRVRFYRTMPAVERPEDPQAWKDQVKEARAEKSG